MVQKLHNYEHHIYKPPFIIKLTTINLLISVAVIILNNDLYGIRSKQPRSNFEASSVLDSIMVLRVQFTGESGPHNV